MVSPSSNTCLETQPGNTRNYCGQDYSLAECLHKTCILGLDLKKEKTRPPGLGSDMNSLPPVPRVSTSGRPQSLSPGSWNLWTCGQSFSVKVFPGLISHPTFHLIFLASRPRLRMVKVGLGKEVLERWGLKVSQERDQP